MGAEVTTNTASVKSAPGRVGPTLAALALVLVHLALSWWYGRLLPWGGDEWYTYDGRTLMAVPNTLIIEFARVILGDVTPGNFMFYRLTGVVWTTLAIPGLFLLGWSERRFSYLVPFSVFLVLSPFVFYQEQYFRYYGYYLCASFGVFLLIAVLDRDYRKYRFLFWGLLLVSPFIYLFLGFQIGCYVAWKEWTSLPKKGRIAVAVVALAGLVVVAFSWGWLVRTGMEVAFSGMTSMADNAVLRGFSPGLVIKPFYFVFESFWGYEVEPTESPWVMVLVLWLFAFLAARFLWLCLHEQRLAILTTVCLLLPLAGIYLVLEPLTPPGATQLESKHALFGLPWLLLIAFGPDGRRGRWLGWVTVLVILAVSLPHTFRRAAPAWPQVVERAVKVIDAGGQVILDGRSIRTFGFYAEDRVDPQAVHGIGYPDAYRSQPLPKGAELMVVHNDWKAYQLLSLKQNWNSGATSEAKVRAIADLEAYARERGLGGHWGLVRFPLHAFTYRSRSAPAPLLPSVLAIPYRDLEFPRTIEGRTMIGAARVADGQTVTLEPDEDGSVRMVGFIKGAADLAAGTVVGTIRHNGRIDSVALSARPDSAYEAAFSRSFKGSTPVDGWHKRPLISQASRYPGSFFAAAGTVHSRDLAGGSPAELTIDHPGIELILLVPEPNS